MNTRSSYLFEDRIDAGRRLAVQLEHLAPEHPIVIGLARGGIVVASHIARFLNAPLIPWVARKVGAPDQPELGVGAVAPGGVVVTDVALMDRLHISQRDIDEVIERETAEMERRENYYRSASMPVEIAGKTVIVVDDGLATGVTALAAIQSIQLHNPSRVLVAFPVCSNQGLMLLEGFADEVVYVHSSDDLGAVGRWYRNFGQIEDEEVVEILRAFSSLGDESANLNSCFEEPESEVLIDVGEANLIGSLTMVQRPQGVVLFAHGTGSGRLSPRNRYVAAHLNLHGFATLLVDLLTQSEGLEDRYSAHLRFDIGMLADRLQFMTEWLEKDPRTSGLPIGYFGASTGAAAALVASTTSPRTVKAIVSRGGRPDLAGVALHDVSAPTLLIVGSLDHQVIPLNEHALQHLGSSVKRLEIVHGAQHLFEEPGALERVADLSANWFSKYLH